MNRLERMKEILKTSPDFGKGVGYKMCVVDELHDEKELRSEIGRLQMLLAEEVHKHKQTKDALKAMTSSYSLVEQKLSEVKELLGEVLVIPDDISLRTEEHLEILKEAENFLLEE